MAQTVWGIVREGVVIPDTPLPEGKRVGIVLVDAPGTLPPELTEELQAWERASANALELVERLAREQAPHEKG